MQPPWLHHTARSAPQPSLPAAAVITPTPTPTPAAPATVARHDVPVVFTCAREFVCVGVGEDECRKDFIK